MATKQSFIPKYALYYTLNKKLDFELDENQLFEKIIDNEESTIIFHLIYEHYRFNNKTVENDLPTTIPTWIVKIESEKSDDYKIDLNDLDINIKKIIWKFLDLKK